MTSKKQIKTNPEIVVKCIEALKEAYGKPNFISKTERGKTIIIKFNNNVNYEFPMNEKEYLIYKKLELGLWK